MPNVVLKKVSVFFVRPWLMQWCTKQIERLPRQIMRRDATFHGSRIVAARSGGSRIEPAVRGAGVPRPWWLWRWIRRCSGTRGRMASPPHEREGGRPLTPTLLPRLLGRDMAGLGAASRRRPKEGRAMDAPARSRLPWISFPPTSRGRGCDGRGEDSGGKSDHGAPD